jgi:hypothetical protein
MLASTQETLQIKKVNSILFKLQQALKERAFISIQHVPVYEGEEA